MKSRIRALAETILHSIDVLEEDCAKRGISVPDIDDVYKSGTTGEDYSRTDPKVVGAASNIVSAALMLVQNVRLPAQSMRVAATSHVTSASLRCAAELNIADLLTAAGSEGLAATELAVKCGVDAKKLSQVLRCLSSQGIFKEVRPDIFANNRLSCLLDKGLASQELLLSGHSFDKYQKPGSSQCALICHIADEGAKASAYLYEALTDQNSAFSGEAGKTAFSKAFRTELSFWEYLELPGQEDVLRRFGIAMEGVSKTEPRDSVLRGFDWESLSNNALVVDVGGGVGAISKILTEAYPQLNIVVQDRPPVVEEGIKRWRQTNPAALDSGRVKFQGHSFFDPQPIKEPAVFFIKSIVHDWSDEYALKILHRLRDAAGPHTKLFAMDKIIPYTCADSNGVLGKAGDNGVKIVQPTGVASTDGGLGNVFPYFSSVMMTVFLNGQERTLLHTVELYREGGWKVVKIYQTEGQGEFASQIQAEPI